jgi:hypothetical protein
MVLHAATQAQAGGGGGGGGGARRPRAAHPCTTRCVCAHLIIDLESIWCPLLGHLDDVLIIHHAILQSDGGEGGTSRGREERERCDNSRHSSSRAPVKQP